MDKFYIDRQFGQPIIINVQKGIVTKCYGETDNFNAEMEKRYKGKEIAFLKKNFEKLMKPCYHHVRSAAIITELQKLAAIESNMKVVGNLMGSINTTPEEGKKLSISYNDLLSRRVTQREKLKRVRKRIQTVHNYPHEV